jgi:hypothetical protein
MKIKKKYIGSQTYSKTLGRFIAVTDENIEILKKDNLYVTTEAKRKPKNSDSVKPVSNDRDA